MSRVIEPNWLFGPLPGSPLLTPPTSTRADSSLSSPPPGTPARGAVPTRLQGPEGLKTLDPEHGGAWF